MKGLPKARLKPLLIVLPLAIFFGVFWGLKIQRDIAKRAESAKGVGRAGPRILAYPGIFPKAVLDAFERRTAAKPELDEARDPEDLWRKLESETAYDIVTLFSYQMPLAIQLARVRRVEIERLAAPNAISPDFRDLPGLDLVTTSVPLLWGLVGIVYDSRRPPPPSTWVELLRARSRAKILIPSSTMELARLATLLEPAKDIKKTLQALVPELVIAGDFLSPVAALSTWPAALPSPFVVVSHGETAFAPLNDPKWKLLFPDDGASLWVLSLVLHRKAEDLALANRFIDFVMEEEQAVKLTTASHQASANRALEATTLVDARLKPSYLRQVPLDKVKAWHDFTRAREIRELLGQRNEQKDKPAPTPQ